MPQNIYGTLVYISPFCSIFNSWYQSIIEISIYNILYTKLIVVTIVNIVNIYKLSWY